ncbi:MAG: DUF1801 domain-containing protein [Gammaproteobacteria bacterium]|nr:DUF1801 domain-containing protein [Gammaproteobacteria bacterium]MDH3506293.1 DUF1801 domain-containing protein [Gammaproteobacteria bacterium]
MNNVNADVKRYLAAVPENRKPLVERLHGLIVGLYPEVAIDMSYRMPTYKVGDGWVALANQKRYVSLYTCGAHHLAAFKKRYPGIKTGTGCINFRLSDEVADEAIEQVIEHAIEHPKG